MIADYEVTVGRIEGTPSNPRNDPFVSATRQARCAFEAIATYLKEQSHMVT